MSKTECKRCGGEGNIAKYAHVQGGRCFACGRSFVVVTKTASRQRTISALTGLLAAGERAAAEGDVEGWLAAVSDRDCAPNLPAVLASADADVKARAIAAFARIGINL